MKLVDIAGRTFHDLLVVCRDGSNKFGQVTWLCRCKCGNKIVVVGTNLKRGDWKSCKPCANEKLRARYTTHGNSHKNNGGPTPTYKSWLSMRRRCSPKSDKAHLYFDRGITICDQWNNFATFLLDMGERPNGTSLDRIDVNGSYSFNNCRWASPKEQAANRRYPSKMELELRLLRAQLKAYLDKYGPMESSNATEA